MENSYQTPAYEDTLLDDVDYSLVQASHGKRFANYLIDVIVTYFFLGVGIGLLTVLNHSNLDEGGAFNLIMILFFVLTMAIVEVSTNGRSLGKLITGTRVVNNDGTRISFGTALGRSLSRIVPFEAFSALGSPCYPWHDRWTNTYVIDIRKSRLQNDPQA